MEQARSLEDGNLEIVAEVEAMVSQFWQGCPDQALEITLEKEPHARQINHAYDLGFALTTGSHTLYYRCEPEIMRVRVEEAERVGREASVPFISGKPSPQG
jgi:hypothetical protein